MESSIGIQLIIVIGTIFVGFFGLIKYITSKFEKINSKFFDYVEKKNGHLERISNRFSDTVDKNHDVINELSTKIQKLNDNSNAVVLALDRAVKVIELQEKKEIMKEINIKDKREDDLAKQ